MKDPRTADEIAADEAATAALPDTVHAADLDAEIAYTIDALAHARAKELRFLVSNAPGSAREGSEVGRHIVTLGKRLKDLQAQLPPPDEHDPAAHAAALDEYMRHLPAEHPLRLAGLPQGTRIVYPAPNPVKPVKHRSLPKSHPPDEETFLA
jgi:hypothetical protein